MVLTAAILNFVVKVASWKVVMVTIEKLIPENMGIAVGISTLGGLEPEIPWGSFYLPTCNKRYF